MAQADYIVANGTGAAVRSDLNGQLAAIVSNNSGATEPATMYAYQWWADTTAGLLKLRNSANSAWITMRQLDGEFSTVPVENGTAAAPSIYFKDSGTDSGFFSPGTDAVAISTAGTNRLHITSGGLVGIGTSSPEGKLTVAGTAAEPPSSGTTANSLLQLKSDVSTELNIGLQTVTGNYGAYIQASDNNLAVPYGLHLQPRGGNVGIGTTTPDKNLVVNQSNPGADVGIRIKNNTTTDAGTTASLRFTTSTGDFDTAALVADRVTNSLRYEYGGSEKVRLTSDGKLLVGTSTARSNLFNATASAQLQSEGTTNDTSTTCLVQNNSAGTDGPRLVLGKSNGSSVGSNTIVASGNGLGIISFQGNDGSEFVDAASIKAEVDGTPGANDMPGRIVLATTADGASSPTERMRISQDGSTYINATSGFNGQLTVAKNGERCLTLHNTATGSTSQEIQNFYRNNVQVGSIATTNSATAYYTSSDYRIKENVTAVDDGIARLQQLKPSRFNFIADPDRTVDGFIAHEVQAVVPEAIAGEKDAVDDDGNPVYQGIDQSKLVPLLTAALQEAIGEIESLKARLTAAGIE
jgi:hypothetical protein